MSTKIMVVRLKYQGLHKWCLIMESNQYYQREEMMLKIALWPLVMVMAYLHVPTHATIYSASLIRPTSNFIKSILQA
jgi:hypothetical protein